MRKKLIEFLRYISSNLHIAKFKDDLPQSIGIIDTLKIRFIHGFVSFSAAYLLFFVAYIALAAVLYLELPAEFSIVIIALIILGVGLILMARVLIMFLYKSVKFTLTEFTPPYTNGKIEFERPNSRLTGYIEWDDPAEKALIGAIVYYLLMVGWFILLRIGLFFVDDPIEWIDSVISKIPDQFFDIVIDSVTNYTSIEIRKIIEQIQDPATVILLVILFGSLIFFVGIGTWNLYYGIKLWMLKHLGYR